MKKISTLLLLLFVFLGLSAQKVHTVQGMPYDGKIPNKVTNSVTKKSAKATKADFSFDDVQFWAGEGENRALLVVDWHLDEEGVGMVWGYKWNGTATGYDMITAIAKADPRFLVLVQLTNLGYTIDGIGYAASRQDIQLAYDLDGARTNPNISFKFDAPNTMMGQTKVPTDPQGEINAAISEGLQTGVIDHPFNYTNYGYAAYDYDHWRPAVAGTKWRSGWYTGYWSYLIKDDINDTWSYSGWGALLRELQDGSMDSWGYQDFENPSMSGVEPREPYDIAQPVAPSMSMSFDDINYWVGSGSNQAAVVVKWNDGKSDDALVWGYKWNGEVKAIDMLKDIAKTDARFYMLLNEGGTVNIGGIGFDLNGKNTTAIINNGNVTYPLYPVDGLVKVTTSEFDGYTILDAEDHWGAGVSTAGVWNYLVMNDGESAFSAESESVLNKVVANNSWNAWNFDTSLSGVELGTDFVAVSPYVEPVIDYTKGIFFVNEDWFGHTNGSVNFLTDEDRWIYRAYTRENPGQAFGATTQFGTIYGDNFYFVSKQASDGGDTQYTPGGRLVVADAKTLKKKAGFDNIGGGDGRSFLGVNATKGYIGTSSGVVLFDIENLSVGTKIAGTDGGSLYNGQIGTMLHIGNNVFACKQSVGIIVIDANADTVVTTIPFKNIGTIVQSKDGYLWGTGYADGLWKIDPYTFEIVEKRAIPAAAQIPGSWGAWTSSLICASRETNTLYWAKMNGSAAMTFFGTKVFKYDIDDPNIDQPFYELTRAKEAFYGSAINLDPLTNNLVITTTQTGYADNYQYNWVHFVDAETGEAQKIVQLDNYYWFPAMSVFPKRTETIISPELTETIDVKGEVKISLNDKITDAELFPSAISKSVTILSGADLITAEIKDDYLVIKPIDKSLLRSAGAAETATVRVDFNAQGKITSQVMSFAVNRSVTGVEVSDQNSVQIYVNNGYLTIKGCAGYTFTLYNINGQAVKELKVNDDSYSEFITVPSGTYILRGKGNEGVVSKKLIF